MCEAPLYTVDSIPYLIPDKFSSARYRECSQHAIKTFSHESDFVVWLISYSDTGRQVVTGWDSCVPGDVYMRWARELVSVYGALLC